MFIFGNVMYAPYMQKWEAKTSRVFVKARTTPNISKNEGLKGDNFVGIKSEHFPIYKN